MSIHRTAGQKFKSLIGNLKTVSSSKLIFLNVRHHNLCEKEEGVWTESSLPGETIDESALNMLLRQISGITTTETVVENAENLNQYGLAEPFLTIEAQLSDGSTVTVREGAENSLLSKYYVQVDDRPDVYLISSYIITDFDKAAEDFILEETESVSEMAAENPA